MDVVYLVVLTVAFFAITALLVYAGEIKGQS